MAERKTRCAKTMNTKRHTLPATGHRRLFTREWLPADDPRGIVCLVHGLGEHSGRYADVADVFTGAGFALSAFDLRGHGKSPGQRGHVRSYEIFLEDIQWLMDEAARRFPGSPVFLYGQSLGGNLALNFALRRPSHLAGVIATAPWLRLAFEPPGARVLLAKAMSYLWPAFSNACGCEAGTLCRDSGVVRRYQEDPFVHDLISAGLFVEASRAGLWALEHAAQLRLPALIMHGTADQITWAGSSLEFAERAGRHCTLKLWDGAYHELHHEPERDAVLAYMLAWLNCQTEDECSAFPQESPLPPLFSPTITVPHAALSPTYSSKH
jgi:alpha-beta hydrolase superfamily lysophospholipase